jgi:hypothetical protein
MLSFRKLSAEIVLGRLQLDFVNDLTLLAIANVLPSPNLLLNLTRLLPGSRLRPEFLGHIV